MWLVCSITVPDFFLDKPFYHFPLLEISPISFDPKLLTQVMDQADAMVISSQETIKILGELLALFFDRPIFCSGEKTKKALPENLQKNAFVGTTEDQEGIFELIKIHQPKHLFYPHGKIIRPFLKEQILAQGIKLDETIVYETQITKKTLPVGPFEGIYFGSSGHAEAFFSKKGELDEGVIALTSGHVTSKTVKKLFEMVPVFELKDWLLKK